MARQYAPARITINACYVCQSAHAVKMACEECEGAGVEQTSDEDGMYQAGETCVACEGKGQLYRCETCLRAIMRLHEWYTARAQVRLHTLVREAA